VSCHIKVGDIVASKNSNRIHRIREKMRPMWIGKYIVVNSQGKRHLKLQNADTGKKLANTYVTSDVKLRPKYAERPEEMIYEEKTAGEEKSSHKCQKPAQRKFNFAI